MPLSQEKKHIIKDSIRRLLELGFFDKEIMDSLRSVGIAEEDARTILKETKAEVDAAMGAGQGQNKTAATKIPPEAHIAPRGQGSASPDTNADEITDDLYGSVYEEVEEKKLRTPVLRKPINNPQYGATGQPKGKALTQQTVSIPPQENPPSTSESLAELWEKGILSTVNARLNEMKQIRDGLDALLDQKISERVKIESKKIETVLDSQRTLFYSKIDAHLDAKADELKRVLESRAKQLEDVNAKVQQQLSQVGAEKKFNSELLGIITQKVSALESARSQVLSETNSSIVAMESKFNQFMSESGRKRDDLEQRIKSALQLESTITEGMTENARQMIESMRLEKEKELSAEVTSRLQELDEMTAKVDPKGITQKVAELTALEERLAKKDRDLDQKLDRKTADMEKVIGQRFEELMKEMTAFRKEVARIEAGNLDELKKLYAANVDDLFAEHLEAWNKAITQKKKEMDALKEQVDIEKYNATLEALDEFKEQFLGTVKKSIQDYNRSKKELAESIIERDKAINDYLKKIDAKMRELSDFQKSFSKDVAELLGKVPEPEKGKGRK